MPITVSDMHVITSRETLDIGQKNSMVNTLACATLAERESVGLAAGVGLYVAVLGGVLASVEV